jgi:hypothetical protein
MLINTGRKYLHPVENAGPAAKVHDPGGSSIVRERPISHESPPRRCRSFVVGIGSLEPIAETLRIEDREHARKIA